MNHTVTVNGKSLRVALSKAAKRALERRADALLLEMELYFSCLIRKRVYVRDDFKGVNAIPVSDKLHISFRPVMTQSCAIRDVPRDNPPVRDMPIVRPERYFPHWLTLDYRRGEWLAEFGYAGEAA
ncbi:MAG: hypothetical protein OEU91_01580 [Gammaproteobacteria bacterium]|jgi:hypothetical protein|nr:hypothetical protein [Gammaproteobacteria bacterium]